MSMQTKVDYFTWVKGFNVKDLSFIIPYSFDTTAEPSKNYP